MGCHWIEAQLRYLTTEEGGRRSHLFSEYRGQFHYEDEQQAWDGVQFFPDYPEQIPVQLGTTVRALIRFTQERWDLDHSKRIQVGTRFEIREGKKLVGQGVVTALSVDDREAIRVSESP